MSGARAGCKSPLSSCRAWLEPSTMWETHREVVHTIPLLSSQCHCVAMYWPWKGQPVQPCSISSLRIVSHSIPGDYLAYEPDRSIAVLPALKNSCWAHGMLSAVLRASLFL